jgi:hypothetical protein
MLADFGFKNGASDTPVELFLAGIQDFSSKSRVALSSFTKPPSPVAGNSVAMSKDPIHP